MFVVTLPSIDQFSKCFFKIIQHDVKSIVFQTRYCRGSVSVNYFQRGKKRNSFDNVFAKLILHDPEKMSQMTLQDDNLIFEFLNAF